MKRRDLWFTLLLGILLSLLGFLPTGANAADASTEDSELKLPAPQVGDRGTYLSQRVEWDGDRWVTASGSHLVSFEWLSARLTADQTGATYQAPRIVEKREPGPYPDQLGVAIRYLAPGSNAVVASETAHTHAEHGRLALSQDRALFDPGQTDNFPGTAGWQHSCGLVNGLQDTQASLTKPVDLFDTCRLGVEGKQPSTFRTQSFEHASTQTSSDRTLHVFEPVEDSRRIQVWFAEEIPYPVRFVYPSPPGLDGNTDVGERGLRVIELANFTQAASNREAAGETLSSNPLPSVSQASRQPWLLDDSNYSHPFPVSEAYEVARDRSERFRDLLEDHPTSYPYSVEGRVKQSDGERERVWRLQFTDTETVFNVQISKTHEPEDQDSDERLLAGTENSPQERSSGQVRYDVQVQGVGDAVGLRPAVDSLPSDLPAVSWMAQATDAILGTPVNDSRVGWTARVHSDRGSDCHSSECAEPEIVLRFGERRYMAPESGGLERDDRVVVFDGNGTVEGIELRRSVDEEGDLPRWVGFAREVQDQLEGSEPHNPVVEGYDGLPKPESEFRASWLWLGLIGIGTGSTIAWTRLRGDGAP